MLVAVLAGQCDVAGERRRQSAHEPAIPRVPRFVALRGQIGRMREMIGNRVLVTPIYPTVEAGLLGTVGSVKTRERDLNLHVCELYGTSGDRVTTRNGACYGRSAISAPSRTGFARSPRSPSGMAAGRFGPCSCRSSGTGSTEPATARPTPTPCSLRDTRGGSLRSTPRLESALFSPGPKGMQPLEEGKNLLLDWV